MGSPACSASGSEQRRPKAGDWPNLSRLDWCRWHPIDGSSSVSGSRAVCSTVWRRLRSDVWERASSQWRSGPPSCSCTQRVDDRAWNGRPHSRFIGTKMARSSSSEEPVGRLEPRIGLRICGRNQGLQLPSIESGSMSGSRSSSGPRGSRSGLVWRQSGLGSTPIKGEPGARSRFSDSSGPWSIKTSRQQSAKAAACSSGSPSASRESETRATKPD